MHCNCAILENVQKKYNNILKIANFVKLVLDYEKVGFRSFNSDSII